MRHVFAIFLILPGILSSIACQSADLPDVEATVVARVASTIEGLPTSASSTMATPSPTLTPRPTATPRPTPRPTATATPTPRPTTTPTLDQVVAEVEPAVVHVLASPRSGTGFIFDSLGWIATNAHVVTGVERVTVVLHDGSQMQGVVVGRNGVVDLAVIYVDTKKSLSSIDLANSDLVQVGQDVTALGFPSGGTRGTVSVSKGIVSAKAVHGNDVEYIQTDAAINPGNSGGPLINSRGQVVGVNTWGVDWTPSGRPITGINYAITSNFARDWLPDLTSGLKTDIASFEVQAGKTFEIPFDVKADTEIQYSFTANLNLDFGILDPSGRWVVEESRVESTEGSLIARSSGRYWIVFDNSFSIFADKRVDLAYLVTPPT